MNPTDETPITFPIYRKYRGINVWFKVLDDRNFIEIKQVGKRFLKHDVKAIQFPEMILIQDMINCQDGRWEPIEEKVYLVIENMLINN